MMTFDTFYKHATDYLIDALESPSGRRFVNARKYAQQAQERAEGYIQEDAAERLLRAIERAAPLYGYSLIVQPAGTKLT